MEAPVASVCISLGTVMLLLSASVFLRIIFYARELHFALPGKWDFVYKAILGYEPAFALVMNLSTFVNCAVWLEAVCCLHYLSTAQLWTEFQTVAIAIQCSFIITLIPSEGLCPMCNNRLGKPRDGTEVWIYGVGKEYVRGTIKGQNLGTMHVQAVYCV